jgi:hypothetical protein
VHDRIWQPSDSTCRLSRITATPGFKAGVDHHEFAAKQRRKAVEANTRLATLQQQVHRPVPGDPSGVWSGELDSSVQRLLRLPCNTREQRERAVGELRAMEQSLSNALQTMETQKGGLNSNQEPVRKQISLHIAEVRARTYEVQAVPADAFTMVPQVHMKREAALLPVPDAPRAPPLPAVPAPPLPADLPTSRQSLMRQDRPVQHPRQSVSPRRGPPREAVSPRRLPPDDRMVDTAEVKRSFHGANSSFGDRVVKRSEEDGRRAEESRRRPEDHDRWLEGSTRRRGEHERDQRERDPHRSWDHREPQRDYEDRSKHRGREFTHERERERDTDRERNVSRQDWERNWDRASTHERRAERPREYRARSRSREVKRELRQERHESPDRRRDSRR